MARGRKSQDKGESRREVRWGGHEGKGKKYRYDWYVNGDSKSENQNAESNDSQMECYSNPK